MTDLEQLLNPSLGIEIYLSKIVAGVLIFLVVMILVLFIKTMGTSF